MAINNLWRIAPAVLGAAAGVYLLATTAALSVEGGQAAAPVDPRSVPVTVHTGDAAARRPGGAADQLLADVRQQGRARVIVGLRFTARAEDSLSPGQLQSQRRAQRAVEDGVLGRIFGSAAAAEVNRYEIIPFMSVWVNAQQLARLLADPQVTSVEKDLVMEPALSESGPLIHADDVHDKNIDGNGFVVAVLDTGVAFKAGDPAKTNPMLVGKVVSEGCFSTHQPGNGFTSTCQPAGTTDTVARGSGINCPLNITNCDHGTHVATIAAGNSSKFDGIARDTKIISLKVATRRQDTRCPSPCVAILEDDVIDALKRVYNLRDTFDIAAANLSLDVRATLFNATCNDTIPALTAIIKKLRDEANIASIIAAGNNSQETQTGIPACISHAVAVGNSAKDDILWRSSNNAPLVDLFAPGAGIKAGVPPGSACITPASGGPYCAKNGTSMAAPHVAGAFALLRNAEPTAKVHEILQALKCSGKTVTHRRPQAGALIELDSTHPRIDILGAYLFLAKPSGARRQWTFAQKADVLDWTVVEGPWRHNAAAPGTYEVGPIASNPNGTHLVTALANCHSSFTLDIRFRRTDPSAFIAGSGFWIKSVIDYKAHTISGYFVAFSRAEDPSTNEPGSTSVTEYKNYAYREPIPCRADRGCTSATSCAAEFVPISQSGFNTLKIVATGTKHTYSMNGTSICTFTDATYDSGAIIPHAKALPPFEAGQVFQIDSLKITLPGSASSGIAAALN